MLGTRFQGIPHLIRYYVPGAASDPPVAEPISARNVLALFGTTPPISLTVHTFSPGNMECRIIGGAGRLVLESADIAFSWAHLNLVRVMKLLLPGVDDEDLPDGLVESGMDLQVSLDDVIMGKEGTSGGLAVALSIMSYYLSAFDVAVHPGCGITGEIDLRGRVLPVGDLLQKIEHAHRAGCSVVIAPFVEAEKMLRNAQAGVGQLLLEGLRQFVLTSLDL